jgi:hypothetical protein
MNPLTHSDYFESHAECEWVFLRLTTQSFKTSLAVFKILLIMSIKVKRTGFQWGVKQPWH